MFKVTKGLAPDIFPSVLNKINKLNYNLCHASHFDMLLVNSICNGTKSILKDKKCGIYYPVR